MTDPETTSPDPAQDVSVRELIGQAAENLKGTVQIFENGYSIAVNNPDNDRFVNITLSSVLGGEKELSLEITNGCISDKSINTHLQLIEISNLLITSDTEDIVSFCYSKNERFFLLNIFSDTKVEVWEGIDRRIGKRPKLTGEIHQQRRRLYSLGRLIGKE
jgi:hypothetical protein